MKNRILRSIILISVFITGRAIAQEAASAKWSLTNPDNGGTGLSSATLGKITAPDELLKGTEINQYTGANNSQRIRMAGTNNSWAAGITKEIDTVYIQFAVIPQVGNSFTVSNISLSLGAASSSYMKANIYYSTDPNFSNPTQIIYSTGATDNFLISGGLTAVNQNLNVNVSSGQTFYLRVYPWYQSNVAASGKYVCLQDVEITGLTASGSSNQLALTTAAISNLTWNSAVSGGNVLSNGGSTITARGVCWNTTGSPTISDNKTFDGSGLGAFQSTLAGLKPLTKYFLRAYASNASGTSYGNEVTFTTLAAPVPAFPGAEGYGKYTTGGRGGKIIEVTNINDDNNPGSFRYAINQTGARIIVFKVSGTIYLKSSLSIKNGNLTIAGQTAPGDGICIAGNTVTNNADNVIIRYLRFRLGDINRVDNDALNGRNHKDIIIDHCSISWSVDEACSFYGNSNITIQWCIISESLNLSLHVENGVLQEHGYGGIWGGVNASFHHNLFAHHNSRNPRFSGGETDICVNTDFRNNVIYNWGNNSVYGGEKGRINIVNNYFKYGPATSSSKRYRIVEPSDTVSRWYVNGNYVYGNSDISNNNWSGGVQGNYANYQSLRRPQTPFDFGEIRVQTAEEAYQTILLDAGVTFPKRDSIDKRIINETQNGTAQYGTRFGGGGKGIIDSQTDVGGWPVLNSTTPPLDTDQDGMPDAWETSHGLNPNEANDGSVINTNGYSNVEIYMNELVAGTYSSVENENSIPTDFVLYQNYPNPFNPSTSVRYSLPTEGFIDIKIYNLQGEVVCEFFNGNMSAGNYTLNWDGKNQSGNFVSSGVYLFTMKYSHKVKAIKMLLIK